MTSKEETRKRRGQSSHPFQTPIGFEGEKARHPLPYLKKRRKIARKGGASISS